MKSATLTVAAFALLNLAVAQPHRVRHVHQDKHLKRDEDVVVTVIETVYAEPTDAPEVVIFVNQFGTPVSTLTDGILESVPSIWSSAIPYTEAPPTPSTSSTPTTLSTSSVPPAPTTAAHATTEAAAAPVVAVKVDSPAPVSNTPATTSTASTPAKSASEGSGFGFAYSPYNSDGSCKTQDQVNTDFSGIPSGYSLVRTYGTDCNQVATVLTAAKSKGLKLFAGVFDLSTLSSEIQTIVAAANGDWSSFDTISVGNELVNSGTASAATVVAAIGTARSLLKAAGYTGKVVTVDTLVAARANPSLCDASDYCAVNSHPFFDKNTAAADSGSFLTTQIPTLRAVLSNQNQDIVITETGWPTQGETNGAAVPSTANQAAALSSIKSAFSSNPESVILFTTYNDKWKTNTAAQFQAEQYWGFLGNCPSG